ncbi:S8 family serine peptidase, partial [Ilumatobacter sp.]|uniref:S8 family serine peptidase n=1 Tax=Ilumatobacter sp. TaxID=1967498 RepID=UPI003C3761FD
MRAAGNVTERGSALLAGLLIILASALGVQALPSQAGAQTGDAEQYIVVLADAPPIEQQPTARAETQAADRMAGQQDRVLEDVDAEPTHRFDTTINGFSVELSPDEVRDLEADPNVRAVTPVRVFGLHQSAPADPVIGTDTSLSPEFLGLRGAGGVWERVGGVDQAGQGQVIGLIDSGLDWANGSFDAADVSAPPADWQGFCDSGEDPTSWPAQACTNKVVGAQYFIDGVRAAGGVAADTESVSPWDVNSHGTHVASIAAGRERTTAAGPAIAGMAPMAHIAAYKVCWDYVNRGQARSGCFEDDILAAVDAAVADGVDVLNLSLGVPNDPGYGDTAYDFALEGAAAAGVFVSMSAGNSGPAPGTLSNGLPWATTVAAATFHSAIPSSVPAVASLSSRGPVNVPAAEQNLLKPDLGAPGIQVLAAVPGGEDVRSGTSMAAPHVAGLAAIIRREEPTWSPMAVKSAMQTTAAEYAGTGTSPLVGGTGFVEPRRFLDPGLVFDAGAADWDAFAADWTTGYDLNTASVTIGALSPESTTTTRRLTNVTDAEVTYTAAFSGSPSLGVTVVPEQVTLAPGDTAEVAITTLNRDAPTGTWQTGWLTWSSSTAPDVRIPVTARGAVYTPPPPPPPPEVDRWGGTDRYETAALIAEQFPTGTDTVYLASGNGFADALAGSPVAARGLVPA